MWLEWLGIGNLGRKTLDGREALHLVVRGELAMVAETERDGGGSASSEEVSREAVIEKNLLNSTKRHGVEIQGY